MNTEVWDVHSWMPSYYVHGNRNAKTNTPLIQADIFIWIIIHVKISTWMSGNWNWNRFDRIRLPRKFKFYCEIKDSVASAFHHRSPVTSIIRTEPLHTSGNVSFFHVECRRRRNKVLQDDRRRSPWLLYSAGWVGVVVLLRFSLQRGLEIHSNLSQLSTGNGLISIRRCSRLISRAFSSRRNRRTFSNRLDLLLHFNGNIRRHRTGRRWWRRAFVILEYRRRFVDGDRRGRSRRGDGFCGSDSDMLWREFHRCRGRGWWSGGGHAAPGSGRRRWRFWCFRFHIVLFCDRNIGGWRGFEFRLTFDFRQARQLPLHGSGQHASGRGLGRRFELRLGKFDTSGAIVWVFMWNVVVCYLIRHYTHTRRDNQP